MQKRALGRSGLHVHPLCFGGNVFGWTADRATSFALLDAFVAEGFEFVDTADSYSAWVPGHEGGESESLIGEWLAQGPRDRAIIATKVAKWKKQPGLKAANIIAACEGSLKRLKTDYIDLYQSHEDDAATPMDETLGAYAKLIAAGKVRAIGASNFNASRLDMAEDIARAGGLPRYETLQPLYNLVERDFEKDLQPLCVEREIGVIPFYSLAAGFLTGKYRGRGDTQGSQRAGTVSKYLNDAGLGLLARMDKIAAARGATLAEIAIAWLKDRPSVVAPIASATSLKQLQSLVRGARMTLTEEEVASLD